MKAKAAFFKSSCLCLLLLFAGACNSSDNEQAMLKQQLNLLQTQVKAWQDHYVRLLCVQDALSSLESLDQALEDGISLASYQQKIMGLDLLLDSISCADKQALEQIMSMHRLAARFWQARNQGKTAELSEDFARQVYPLWRSFDYPWPDGLSMELKQALDDYPQASGPAAHKSVELVKNTFGKPQAASLIAGIANQLLWHEAHKQLLAYKVKLLTPPYPLQ